MEFLTKQLQRAALAAIDRSSNEMQKGVSTLESVASMKHHAKWGDNICWVVDRLKGQAKDGVESLGLAGAMNEQQSYATNQLSKLTNACTVVKDATCLPTTSAQVSSVLSNIPPVKVACLELSGDLESFAHALRDMQRQREQDRARLKHIDKPQDKPSLRGL